MKVTDLFQVGGATIFDGVLETEEKYISRSPCRIEIDGKELSNIEVGGEVFTGKPHTLLWTKSPVNLNREMLNNHEVWLISE